MNPDYERLRWQLRHQRHAGKLAWFLVVSGTISLGLWVVTLVFGHPSTVDRALNLLIALFVLTLGIVGRWFLRSGGEQADQEPPPSARPTPERLRRANQALIVSASVMVVIGATLVVTGVLASIAALVVAGAVWIVAYVLVFVRLRRLMRRGRPRGPETLPGGGGGI